MSPGENIFGAVTRVAEPRATELINTIAPALRALLAEEEGFKVVTFDDSEIPMSLAGGAEGREVAMGGPLCPDQIVYCKSFPLWFEPVEGESVAELVARLREAIKDHTGHLELPAEGSSGQGAGAVCGGG